MREVSLRTFLVLASLLLTASAAGAQSLPNFDMKGRCMRLAMTPNMPTETIYDSCMAGEEAAYAQLYHWWDDIASGTRANCLNVARGSYANLQLCIDSQAGVSQ
jgi:hypothetical protein